MANFQAIHSVGSSLITYLRNAYPEPLRTDQPCDFRLLSSGEMTSTDEFGTTLSLFLYRVTINEHLRNVRRESDWSSNATPLGLDLHFLLTVWADTALAEQSILAWAMHHLHRYPRLDTSSLSPEANWTQSDIIQVLPAELSNEDLMRIWDTIDPAYRLSVSYIARLVRIDPDEISPPAVVATKFEWQEQEVTL